MAALQILAIVELLLWFAPCHEQKFIGFICTIKHATPHWLKRRAIGSMNARLRKIIKTRGHFPCDDAATRLIWLALRNITADWGRAANHWKTAMKPFTILCEDRFTKGIA